MAKLNADKIPALPLEYNFRYNSIERHEELLATASIQPDQFFILCFIFLREPVAFLKKRNI